MTRHTTACALFLAACAVAHAPSDVAGDAETAPPAVEIAWDDLRDYVAAHIWIADIDFRDGDIQGMHVCAGFNAFREPEQLAALGFDVASADPRLQAAAFTLTINTPAAMEVGAGLMRTIRQSAEYRERSGAARLEYARREMWQRISSDEALERGVRETARRMQEVTARLVDAGLLSAAGQPADPYPYMLAMNTVLANAARLDAILGDPAFVAIEDPASRRAEFKRRFGEVAASAVEEPSERKSYRRSVEEELDRLYGATGTFVVQIQPTMR